MNCAIFRELKSAKSCGKAIIALSGSILPDIRTSVVAESATADDVTASNITAKTTESIEAYFINVSVPYLIGLYYVSYGREKQQACKKPAKDGFCVARGT
jgi:hypothetical protein